MRRALYKADTNGNLLLKFKSYSSYIPHSPAPFPQLEGDAAPGRQRGPQNSSQPAACHAHTAWVPQGFTFLAPRFG